MLCSRYADAASSQEHGGLCQPLPAGGGGGAGAAAVAQVPQVQTLPGGVPRQRPGAGARPEPRLLRAGAVPVLALRQRPLRRGEAAPAGRGGRWQAHGAAARRYPQGRGMEERVSG